jgi:hypothetical protein
MTKIILMALIALSVIMIKPTYATAPEMTQEEQVKQFASTGYRSMVDYIAPQYNQDPWLIYNICNAESNFNPNANHDGGRGKGICGIHKSTFEYWEKQFGVDLNYNSDFDQIKMTSIAFSKGSLYRNQWSTYVRYVTYGVFHKYQIKKTTS